MLKRKKFLLVNFFIAVVVAAVYTFLIARKQFSSQITFLPPMPDTHGIGTLLSGFDLGAALGEDIMPEQILTVFNSRATRRSIIDEFALYRKYRIKDRPNKFQLALKKLDKNLELETEEVGKMGISKLVSYTLTAYHESPDTSFLMVNRVFSLMDSTIREVSSNRGKRDRVFIEKQLALNEQKLDSLQEAFAKFRVENKAYNIPEQINVALKSYGQLRAALIANEIQVQRLQSDYKSNYPTIAALRKTNAVLRRKLDNLEKLTKPDILVGLEMSTELAPIYANYMRDVEVQNELILLLSEELEQAKLKEARDVSPLQVVDPSYVPLYKARPKRLFLLVGIVALYMIILCTAVILQHLYGARFKGSRAHDEILEAFRGR